ncbi:glycosyltransferase family 39 protein [Haladaptatus sp. W1]|uniref:glycosyltransferase family 39 protein n=1 Tax=Haladaptatus sp. W1 TaxID=1897478 RepID=UPI001585E6FD|nr:glycosyltransferase family 39 protein [Haladaptatus sp. W1]
MIIPLSELHINPYSNNDAVGFEKAATAIAHGTVTNYDPLYVYHAWGSILAPFWLLPGPSSVYAHVFVALLGAVSIYMVYRIAEHLHSRTAAGLAVAPMMFFPSFLLIHTSFTREAFVLCMVTTTTMLLVVPSDTLSLRTRWLVASICLGFAALVRYENLPFYLLAIILGLGIREYYRRGAPEEVIKTGSKVAAIATILGIPLWVRLLRWGIHHVIVPQRVGRAFGNSAYLIVVPDTILKVLWFTPVGISYFYFAPFPWMIQSARFIPVMFEGLVNLSFVIFAIFGLRRFVHSHSWKTVPLLVVFVLLSVLYGLVEANVGAAVRHRQMLIWVVYIVGAVGVTELIWLSGWTVDTDTSTLSASD